MNSKSKRILSIVLAATLAVGPAATLALNEGQADDYTDQVIAMGGTGKGTVFGREYLNDYEADESLIVETALPTSSTTYPDSYPKELIKARSDEELKPIIDGLMKVMTFDEKIYMISMNSDPENRNGVGYMTGIPRLGIPESRLHDGPAGISTSGDAYVETTNPPMQLLASNSWSEDMVAQYGALLGREQVSIGSGWQLGVQYDMARTPFWARAKDSFGEDYLLTSKLSVAQTNGIHSTGGIPMAKHIGAYSTDGDTLLWVEVDEQTLHTAYLYPFESAAKEANVNSIMGTYNRLNGFYVSSNKELQINILRNMWDWRGAMVPDWGANQEFSMALGTDISQSNFSSVRSDVLKSMSAGTVDMVTVDRAVEHSLYALGYSGYLNLVELDEETGLAKEDPTKGTPDKDPIKFERTYAEDRKNGMLDESNEVAQEIAEKGIVMLKNENETLPLTKDDYTGDNSVALIGYGATNLVGGTGGERSFGVLEYMKTPFEAIKEIAGENANITAEVMQDVHGTVIPADYLYQDEAGTKQGLVRTYGILAEDNTSGGGFPGGPGGQGGSTEKKPVDMEGFETGSFCTVDSTIDFTTGHRSFQNNENGTAFEDGDAYTWKGYLKAPQDGEYTLVMQSNGGKGTAKITVDGAVKSASASDGVSWDFYTNDGLNYGATKVTLKKDQLYKVVVTANATSPYRDQGLKFTWITPSDVTDNYQNALTAAAQNDTVVMFTRTGATGHGPVSVTDYDLSLDEISQIKDVQKAAKDHGNKFVLVVFGRTGFSFEGDWLDDTDALIVPYYPGQAGGTALANILTGKVNPSGKLTMTFPKKSEDTLLTIDEETCIERGGDQKNPTADGFTAKYTEGLNFGYRWYDDEGIEPQYPFGFGLSYTTFAYSDYSVKRTGDIGFDVSVKVTNTGDVTGSEIVQVYLGKAASVPQYVQQAEKQLCAFGRVEDLKPGESKVVTMHIEERMLQYWDSELDLIEREDGTKDKWVIADGEREIMVGSSSDNLTWSTTIDVIDEALLPDTDKTTLNKVIAYAEEQMAKDDYIFVDADVRAGFEAALEEAVAVRDNKRSTQPETEKAWTTLVKWIHGLDIRYGDKTLLLEAITAAGTYNLDNYVEAGKQAFKDALAEAQKVYEDKFIDQKTIDDTADALVDAILALRLKANTSNLDALLKQAKAVNFALYTDASVMALKTAIQNAETVLASDPSEDDQAIVDSAADGIQDGMDGLVEKADDSKKDDDSSKTEDPKQDDSSKSDTDTSSNSKPASDVAGAKDQTTSTASASNGKKKNVYTGDATPIALAFSLAGLSALAVLTIGRKKKQ
ncbi:glycoside hydrolase family 3 C-terminal domain-containing protein [Candidatus Soleaferrea massiliensis]|uniref:glycoside hydrolase family 3 C-terminal domain-containing protein n=1 Tax=Candidatus Soleaferrea massiliensis TaxID=1470354 RepID=UPI00058C4DAF|nr:glycoside hydrolase family 3 C-terminal domain-containing protein [Candidatus Soleaferrea massiliensis]